MLESSFEQILKPKCKSNFKIGIDNELLNRNLKGTLESIIKRICFNRSLKGTLQSIFKGNFKTEL